MKSDTCMTLGKDCGLTTIEECYDNVYNHAGMIFKYEDMGTEILELQKDIFYNDSDEFCRIFNSVKEDLISNGWKTKEDMDDMER